MDHRRSLHRVTFYHFCQLCTDETRHRRVNGSLHFCLRCSLQTFTRTLTLPRKRPELAKLHGGR